ncbi:anaerobic ribonucleoside-triphosphate reductase activating protein [Actinotalea solisilvae]|uniref:anaerobic ribonucleoside-triphosphate reductase activating protein n=1 Tax=Actinotalea solisilvae TaxID=2072922 RepID=UPI0018F1E87F|nr:anaerobic ribonucleoside-triphosphate reductase activating protein [Actinotalea solisilvae]
MAGPTRPAERAAPAGRAQATAASLAIAGLVPLSTCDWPDRLVATVFLQGCPWRCGYCHNPALLDPREPGRLPWSDVTALLARRAGLLDGVVFSGGEPTRQAGLLDAVRQVRAAGFGVGLHTAGAYPRRLAALLPWVDWVGLDLKAPSGRYDDVTGVPGSARPAFASLRLALDAGVALQVRTTVDPTVLDELEVARLSALLAGLGVRDHVLQEVRTEGVRPEYAEALARAATARA